MRRCSKTSSARGNNGLRKTKYLTFTIEADSVRNAKPRLERIEAELLGNFKRMGVHAQALDGKARLALLHGIFHMDTKEPFAFDWDWLAPSGRLRGTLSRPPPSSSRTGARSESERSFAARRSCRLPPPTCPTVRWKRFWRWTAA